MILNITIIEGIGKTGADWDSAPEFGGTLLLHQSTCDARGGITSSAQMGTARSGPKGTDVAQ